jgi:hypothetical protein
VGESRAQLLGGHFSIMMLVEVADGDVEKMHEELRSVEGMSTGCFEAVDPKMVEMKAQIGCECLLMVYLFSCMCSRCVSISHELFYGFGYKHTF